MSKEKRFVIQVDPLEIEYDAIFDNKELRLYECQSDMMSDICSLLNKQESKISDLEAKLAESEKEVNRFKSMKNREQLIKENEALKDTIAVVLSQKSEWVKSCNELKQQLADAEEHIDNLELQLREQYELVDEKDEQLSKKDKEIEKLNKRIESIEKVEG